MTEHDIRLAALHEALHIAEAEQLARGVPRGTKHGQVAYGCAAVALAIRDRILDAMRDARTKAAA